MTALQFEIAPEILEKFPEMTVYALTAIIPKQSKLMPSILSISVALEDLREELSTCAQISSLPAVAMWRSAYQSLGVKPSKFPSSIEALLKRLKKGAAPETGIPTVDLYNAVSLAHRSPLGAYDIDKLSQSPIRLRNANPNRDAFEPLGGSSDSYPINPELAVYAQDSEILCWGFNSRDSKKSAVDGSSSRVVFFGETTLSTRAESVASALQQLAKEVVSSGGDAGPINVFSAQYQKGEIAGFHAS